MSLDTYANLQTAIQTEIDNTSTEFTASVPDLINRAESKINRKLRCRQMEQLAYMTYSTATTDRKISFPSGFLERRDLFIKLGSEADSKYTRVVFKSPKNFYLRYTDAGRPEYYTIRKHLEFDRLADASYRVQMHYLKAWDIATDSTNWLLTNHPDIYLYGSMAEAEMFFRNRENVGGWKMMFEEAIRDLNRLDERTRDDAILSTPELSRMSHRYRTYNVLTDEY